jgi:hypothetical protein
LTPPLQRLDANPDLVGGLADRIGGRNRAIDQRSETTDRRSADQAATERADAGAQQLRLTAEALQPARCALARGLDALQALLAALADAETSSALTWPPPSTARRTAYVCVRRAMIQPMGGDLALATVGETDFVTGIAVASRTGRCSGATAFSTRSRQRCRMAWTSSFWLMQPDAIWKLR